MPRKQLTTTRLTCAKPTLALGQEHKAPRSPAHTYTSLERLHHTFLLHAITPTGCFMKVFETFYHHFGNVLSDKIH